MLALFCGSRRIQASVMELFCLLLICVISLDTVLLHSAEAMPQAGLLTTLRKRALDSLDGDDFTLRKRALDLMDGDGFGFEKRALDNLEGDDFVGLKKRALDNLDGEGFSGFDKRALDSLDGEGFGGFNKRSLDMLEGDGFGLKKRALDSLEGSGFGGFQKRAVAAVDLIKGSGNAALLEAPKTKADATRLRRALENLNRSRARAFGERLQRSTYDHQVKRALDALEGGSFGF